MQPDADVGVLKNCYEQDNIFVNFLTLHPHGHIIAMFEALLTSLLYSC